MPYFKSSHIICILCHNHFFLDIKNKRRIIMDILVFHFIKIKSKYNDCLFKIKHVETSQ